MKKAVIDPVGVRSYVAILPNNTNWAPLDVVQIPSLEGDFEVRSVEINSVQTTYNVMPL